MVSKWWFIGLCAIGLVIALTALYYHYEDDGSKFCDVNDTFNCSTVYKSQYSYIFGFPVPLLGVIGYLGFALLVNFRKRWGDALGFTEKDAWWYLALIATAMFLYQTGMTSLEFLGLIPAFCILCLISQAVVTALAVLSWINYRQ